MDSAFLTMDRQNSSGNGKAGKITHEVNNGVLRVILTGSVNLSAATAYATLHQSDWMENTRILWDLLLFDPSGVTSQDILNIQHAFAEIMSLRPGGRSAVLVNKELDLVARVTLALSDERESPIAVRSFLDEEEAILWLHQG